MDIESHFDKTIIFVDTEIEPKSGKILDIGGIKNDGSHFHSNSTADFTSFLKDAQFICGHNIINHDIKYIGPAIRELGMKWKNVVDTLFLSPLLFPTSPYHALLKDDKLQTEELNNPLNDSIKARDLFFDEVDTFKRMDGELQDILYLLLKNHKEFTGFFHYIGHESKYDDLKSLIQKRFNSEICEQAALAKFISESPIELAYGLSLINSFVQNKKKYSITPPWVLKNYPLVEQIVFLIRNKPCIEGCSYCDKALDPRKALKRYFGYDSYRTFGGEPLQEDAVAAAISHKSLLAVFPTGGGKSLTFQIPALVSSETSKGLTIVISPLQSLMKDQVDNLERNGITDAVTINGLLDPIERAQSFERIEKGSASILYISPESLRSRSIERLILGRKVARFVIDEAHCFSSWGQDFRVDYLYIGDFIQSIQEKKSLQDPIPISCFTATAKQKVIEDIQAYFAEKLSLKLELFTSNASRTNLQYKVYHLDNKEEKIQRIRDLLEEKQCPTIIYVSRTRRAYELADELSKVGYDAKPYHGKMDKDEKSANQDSFIKGETQVMVATSAFGMGVDKKDVGLVIHYDISDSLENYVQESGRAGRDESISADCYVLYNEEDLDKHFLLLNQTKLSAKEIQQIWRAIKDLTSFRSKVSKSALEIARKAGWDDRVQDMETRVTTAISALEESGYLKRGQNMPRIFANSILSKNAQEAIDKIISSEKFQGKQEEKAIRIIKKLFSSKSKKYVNNEEAESRVDYISDHLGIVKKDVIDIIYLLREENILADAKDLTAFIKKGEHINRSLNTVRAFSELESFLLSKLEEEEKEFHLKELNEEAENKGFDKVNINMINTVYNYWAIKNWVKRARTPLQNHVKMQSLFSQDILQEKLKNRQVLARFIIEYLFEKVKTDKGNDDPDQKEVLVEFSVNELKTAYEQKFMLFKVEVSLDDIEDSLFYLTRIDALKIEGGFLVVYNGLTIERLEQNNRKQYTQEDYQKLSQFYESKVQQIHIVGEYAKRMLEDYKDALQFVEDYFLLNQYSFLNKYFKGSRKDDIKQNITRAKFEQIFGGLSPVQLKVIRDNEAQHIVVTAGPGSGKTRVLVHKLASLFLMEDVKHEQLLMLTFSRSAATEFKKRLIELVGNAAAFIEIKTFHSYCFDLLGRKGSLESSQLVVQKAIEKIKNNEVEANRITKTVLVIDEAQDMDEHEYGLVTALMEQNDEMRVIAVGDDDQNIYEFRGASSIHLKQLAQKDDTAKYELIDNYRSKSNLVDFSNQFAIRISERLKNIPIIPIDNSNGEIKIVRYQSRMLILPLVNDVLATDLSGTTCVLTKTNAEALQVAGLLINNNIQAKLIQSNDSFSLYNLLEIRFFLSCLQLFEDSFIINEDNWLKAKRNLVDKFQKSNKLEIAKNIIINFEKTCTKRKYKVDFEEYLRESKLEEFYTENSETILVSTMHKAKGKEFDNVFLMLDNFTADTDETKRLLYVAMTRAKYRLSVHLNTDVLEGINVNNIKRFSDNNNYENPDQIAVHLGLKDIWLDYFINQQPAISQLVSGDTLLVNKVGCSDNKGNLILKFSKKFVEEIEKREQQSYILESGKVNFIVYWRKEGADFEVLIVLPELYFKKKQ